METQTITSPSGVAIQYVENVLEYFPENPLEQPISKAWMWMTDSYTKFQIATWGSLLIHEVILLASFSTKTQYIPYVT